MVDLWTRRSRKLSPVTKAGNRTRSQTITKSQGMPVKRMAWYVKRTLDNRIWLARSAWSLRYVSWFTGYFTGGETDFPDKRTSINESDFLYLARHTYMYCVCWAVVLSNVETKSKLYVRIYAFNHKKQEGRRESK